MTRHRARLAVLTAALAVTGCSAGGQRLPDTGTATGTGFTVISSSFSDAGSIPARFACPDQGGGVSPAVAFAGVPEATVSLAVVVSDPDAGDFVHWAVAGLGPGARIPPGSLPPGAVAGANDAGSTGWFGPCPPSGTHRYVVTAYALDTDPALDPGFGIDRLTDAVEGHLLAQASLEATFANRS